MSHSANKASFNFHCQGHSFCFKRAFSYSSLYSNCYNFSLDSSFSSGKDNFFINNSTARTLYHSNLSYTKSTFVDSDDSAPSQFSMMNLFDLFLLWPGHKNIKALSYMCLLKYVSDIFKKYISLKNIASSECQGIERTQFLRRIVVTLGDICSQPHPSFLNILVSLSGFVYISI
jgi:hypothetical protein